MLTKTNANTDPSTKFGPQRDPLVGSMVGVADRIRSQRDYRADGGCGGSAGGWGN